jgi:hypothetical protein
VITKSGTQRYGQYYWCIKSRLSPDGETYVMADRIEVTTAGVLIAWGGCRPEKGETPQEQQVMLSLAPQQWSACFAASLIDGAAVAVEHWKDEVVR